jgi:hypothetical protein
MKGRGAARWAFRGRNRNTSASSAAARSLTISLGSAPCSVTTAGTTRVSTPSLLAQRRSTRRPTDDSGRHDEGHASRRADWRPCQQCSTAARAHGGSYSGPSLLRCSDGRPSSPNPSRERAHPRPQGCALFLCAAEGKSAGEPLAPEAGRHPPWVHAAHLSEARGKLCLACFAEQIGVALGVIPKMGFWVHDSSFHS